MTRLGDLGGWNKLKYAKLGKWISWSRPLFCHFDQLLFACYTFLVISNALLSWVAQLIVFWLSLILLLKAHPTNLMLVIKDSEVAWNRGDSPSLSWVQDAQKFPNLTRARQVQHRLIAPVLDVHLTWRGRGLSWAGACSWLSRGPRFWSVLERWKINGSQVGL